MRAKKRKRRECPALFLFSICKSGYLRTVPSG
nr:MAG TPA: hypothetical protein [Caudoviricetes sp.]